MALSALSSSLTLAEPLLIQEVAPRRSSARCDRSVLTVSALLIGSGFIALQLAGHGGFGVRPSTVERPAVNLAGAGMPRVEATLQRSWLSLQPALLQHHPVQAWSSGPLAGRATRRALPVPAWRSVQSIATASAAAGRLTAVPGEIVDKVKVQTALVSVFDKTGLQDIAEVLAEFKVHVISTDVAVADYLRDLGCTVQDLSEYTGSPEILDGQVRTLHPKVHGGLLGARGNGEHLRQLDELGIRFIDLVITNLQPYEDTFLTEDDAEAGSFDACIDTVDIGGPALIRASAKNCAGVTIVTSPRQYPALADYMRENDGSTSYELRKNFAADAYAVTAAYDATLSAWCAREALGITLPPPTPAAGTDRRRFEPTSSGDGEFDTGVILHWDGDKGIGFIKPNDPRQKRLLFHASGLMDPEGSVRKGMDVVYRQDINRYRTNQGKAKAVDVRLAPGGVAPSLEAASPSLWGRFAGEDDYADEDDYDEPRPRKYGRGRESDSGREYRGAQSRGRPSRRPAGGVETGKLVRWNPDKGFGFILPSRGGDRLFFHVSSILSGEGSVNEGDVVEFTRGFDDRARKEEAKDVQLESGGYDRQPYQARSRRRAPPSNYDDEPYEPPGRGRAPPSYDDKEEYEPRGRRRAPPSSYDDDRY